VKIWDTHVHFPFGRNPDAEVEKALERYFEEFERCGIERAALLCAGRFGMTFERAHRLLEPYRSVAVSVAFIQLDATTPELVRELKQMGYTGLKILGPAKPYDHEDYWPVYATAQELNMPIVFHLGVVGGACDLLITDPHYDVEAARRIKTMMGMAAMNRMMGGRSAQKMAPFHLDTLATLFPRLRMIGAHLGGTGYYDQSASVARWRPNVWFDVSGGWTIQRHAEERELIGKEISPYKLTFGSDCQPHEIKPYIDNWQRILEAAGMTDEQQARFWWHNAAEIFGDEPTVWADELESAKAP
jgi:predicted TIM-barrel fold metal-dependent hydrolase